MQAYSAKYYYVLSPNTLSVLLLIKPNSTSPVQSSIFHLVFEDDTYSDLSQSYLWKVRPIYCSEGSLSTLRLKIPAMGYIIPPKGRATLIFSIKRIRRIGVRQLNRCLPKILGYDGIELYKVPFLTNLRLS